MSTLTREAWHQQSSLMQFSVKVRLRVWFHDYIQLHKTWSACGRSDTRIMIPKKTVFCQYLAVDQHKLEFKLLQNVEIQLRTSIGSSTRGIQEMLQISNLLEILSSSSLRITVAMYAPSFFAYVVY